MDNEQLSLGLIKPTELCIQGISDTKIIVNI